MTPAQHCPQHFPIKCLLPHACRGHTLPGGKAGGALPGGWEDTFILGLSKGKEHQPSDSYSRCLILPHPRKLWPSRFWERLPTHQTESGTSPFSIPFPSLFPSCWPKTLRVSKSIKFSAMQNLMTTFVSSKYPKHEIASCSCRWGPNVTAESIADVSAEFGPETSKKM